MATDLADFINMAAQRARFGKDIAPLQRGGAGRAARGGGSLPLDPSQRAAALANASVNTQGLETGGSARALADAVRNDGGIFYDGTASGSDSYLNSRGAAMDGARRGIGFAANNIAEMLSPQEIPSEERGIASGYYVPNRGMLGGTDEGMVHGANGRIRGRSNVYTPYANPAGNFGNVAEGIYHPLGLLQNFWGTPALMPINLDDMIKPDEHPIFTPQVFAAPMKSPGVGAAAKEFGRNIKNKN